MQEEPNAADTVVCVHGAGAGGWEWGVWARVFNVRGLDVIAPDLMPAVGGLAATRFADYHGQVVAWCRASPRAPILIGASLGGLLALAVAAEVEPAALVLINPMPPRGLTAERAPARPAIVAWARERSLAGTRRAMPDADDAARMYAYRRWRDESGAVLDAAHAGIACTTPSCPILVIASADDEDVPAATSRALASQVGADFELIARASHVGPLLGRIAPHTAELVHDWLHARTVVSI